ncbi:MAG TPA: endonuclease/exonuclease/phosphatase family protein [Solirubrobacteraceae bacterium]
MTLVVVTWNLYHGRGLPPAGRDLLPDFAAVLARWDWNLALLQEVPPWWPPELARVAGAEHRLVLTSRNQLLPVRRALATRWPDLMRSGGGGANAILARGPRITEHLRLCLCRLPEQRWLHAVRLENGIWAGNLHATAHRPSRAADEDARAAAAILDWSAGSPALLGGDFNLRHLELAGLRHAGGHDVDHIFASGLAPLGGARTLEHGSLSDHAPVAVELAILPR